MDGDAGCKLQFAPMTTPRPLKRAWDGFVAQGTNIMEGPPSARERLALRIAFFYGARAYHDGLRRPDGTIDEDSIKAMLEELGTFNPMEEIEAVEAKLNEEQS